MGVPCDRKLVGTVQVKAGPSAWALTEAAATSPLDAGFVVAVVAVVAAGTVVVVGSPVGAGVAGAVVAGVSAGTVPEVASGGSAETAGDDGAAVTVGPEGSGGELAPAAEVGVVAGSAVEADATVVTATAATSMSRARTTRTATPPRRAAARSRRRRLFECAPVIAGGTWDLEGTEFGRPTFRCGSPAPTVCRPGPIEKGADHAGVWIGYRS